VNFRLVTGLIGVALLGESIAQVALNDAAPVQIFVEPDRDDPDFAEATRWAGIRVGQLTERDMDVPRYRIARFDQSAAWRFLDIVTGEAPQLPALTLDVTMFADEQCSINSLYVIRISEMQEGYLLFTGCVERSSTWGVVIFFNESESRLRIVQDASNGNEWAVMTIPETGYGLIYERRSNGGLTGDDFRRAPE